MTKVFLPFTPKAKQIEIKAIAIKGRFGYGPYDPIDPHELASRMDVSIVPDAWFDGLDDDLRRALLNDHSREWSAGSITVDDRLHVLLNPTHTDARKSPTLAEELVHVGLGHPASKLTVVDGLTFRTCDHQIEGEAYAVATALLMPYRSTFNHLNGGGQISDVPAIVPVSEECRAFRTKTAGLWHVAKKRARS